MRRLIVAVLVVTFTSGAGLTTQAQEPSRRILIVADALSIQFRSTPRVRDLMSRTQRLFSRTGDVVRIVSTGGAHTGAPGSTINNVVGQALAPRAVGTATATSSDARELQLRSELSSSTLAAALRSISAEGSGPITVVYLTEGYPTFVPAPTEFVEQALRVNATVYVIDPRGWSDTGRQFDAKDWEAYIAATLGSIRELASRTKGTAVLTQDDFDALLSVLTAAQVSSPEFEVASVKPSGPAVPSGRLPPGQWRARSRSLVQLIGAAYPQYVFDGLVVGGWPEARSRARSSGCARHRLCGDADTKLIRR